MKQTVLSVLAVALSLGTANAQLDGKPWGLSYRYNFYDYASDANFPSFNNFSDMTKGAEVGAIYNFNQYFALNVPLRLATVTPKGTTAGTFLSPQSLFGIDALLNFKVFGDKNWFISPYAVLGVSNQWLGSTYDLGIPFGLGLNFKIADGVNFNLQSLRRASTTDNRSSWIHGVGLTFDFGAGAATEEKAIETPKPTKIAVVDDSKAKAEAAEAAAKAEAEASAMRAKAEAEAAAARAEADAAAAKAKAEAEAAAAKARAEADAAAKAAAAAAAAAANKDSDGDGVPDREDKCPTAAGPASNGGCPVAAAPAPKPAAPVTEEIKKEIAYATELVQFQTGSSVLTGGSNAVLDKVAAIMVKNPGLKLSIGGHTDSQGNENTNRALSAARAKSCHSYLVARGVAGTRMSHAGYGSSQPRADNKTAEGRAANRRVEFNVSN
jgi:OmpA-OmpF porin, OOP family